MTASMRLKLKMCEELSKILSFPTAFRLCDSIDEKYKVYLKKPNTNTKHD